MPQFLPVLMLLAFAALTAAVILLLHSLLSAKGQTAARPTSKTEPYECGVPPVGTARTRFHVRFFLVAILFLLFDVEIVFFYLWAPMFPKLGWFGLFEMLFFMAVLVLGFAYAWGKRAIQQE